jgi:hypothetical protein
MSGHAVRTQEDVRIDVRGFFVPGGNGYVLLADATTVHTLDVINARRLAVGLLVAIAEALGEGGAS